MSVNVSALRGVELAVHDLAQSVAYYRDVWGLEEVAQEIEKFKGFGEDTISSFTIYIRNMKR